MKIVFKSYRRRDGSWMLYINNDRKVSLGVSPEKGFGPSAKLTQGQLKLRDAAMRAFFDNAEPFAGTAEAHKAAGEPVAICGPYTLFVTDVARVGGVAVPADGAYVMRDGKILPCGAWVAEKQDADEEAA
jgi:hypothetical protein